MSLPSFSTRPCAIILCALLTTAAFGALSLGSPTEAFAQNSADSQISALLDQAMEDYDMLMIEEAEQALEQAVVLAARNNLRTPAVARTYVMLGIVRFAATRDEALTEEAFIAALETDPNSVLFPVYETPELGQIFERARRRAKPPEPVVESPSETQQPRAEASPLEHRPIPRANAGQAILFEANVAESVPVFRVFLNHRRFGEDEFTRSEMMPSSNTRFAFSLDARHVRTSQIDYFIEAVDRTGTSLASSGRASNPHRITVLGSGEVAADPTEGRRVAEVTLPDDDLKLTPDQEPAGGFYATLLGGTDIGFLTSGTAPTAQIDREVTPGFVAAFAHTKLDLGWRLTDRNSLGMYWRWQFSPPQDFDSLVEGSIDRDAPFWQHEEECFGLGLPGDCMIGFKYQRDISTGAPRFYSSVGLGIGRVRNWLRLKHNATLNDGVCDNRDIFQDQQSGVPFCYIRDTVRTGWAHFGFGGGFFVPLSSNLDFVTDTYVMVLFPDTSINLDVNLGFRFRM